MGRGRAKAKQQKVARELKYNSHYTDLDALQRELSGSTEPAEGAEDGDSGEYDSDDWATARHWPGHPAASDPDTGRDLLTDSLTGAMAATLIITSWRGDR
jgi:Protein of unknown function (DUF3073)